MSQQYSLTEKAANNTNGTSNYVKAVYDQSGTRKLFYIWSFDSMSNDCEGVPGWGCVYPNTVQWYLDTSKKLIEEDGQVL